MSPFIAALMLLGGLVALIAGAESLVRGASALAKRMRVSEIAIGLTVVAMGTSTPEMVINVFASIEGRADVAFGNVIGSNLFNTLCVLGVAGLIRPLVVHSNTVWREIPMCMLMTLVLFFLVNDGWENGGTSNVLSRMDGCVLLSFFAIFVVYVFGIAKIDSPDSFEVTSYSLWLSIVLLVVGLGMLFVGGKFCVDGAVAIARHVGWSEKFIALTIISAGTSLPELATSAVAAWRGRSDIAVGNIVGSSIFNVLAILGLSGAIRAASYSTAFNVDIYVLLGCTLVLMATMFTGKRHRLDRWESALLLAGYIGYFAYVLHRG